MDKDGNIGIAFTANKMAWAYQKGTELHFGMRPGTEEVEEVNFYRYY